MKVIETYLVRCEDGNEDILEVSFDKERFIYTLAGVSPPRVICKADNTCRIHYFVRESGLFEVLDQS